MRLKKWSRFKNRWALKGTVEVWEEVKTSLDNLEDLEPVITKIARDFFVDHFGEDNLYLDIEKMRPEFISKDTVDIVCEYKVIYPLGTEEGEFLCRCSYDEDESKVLIERIEFV